MRRAVDDYMAPSPVVSLLATSTTVGSKEGTFSSSHPPSYALRRRYAGWTPSTFVSSRSDRAKQKVSRPEDYMDEEDLAELRENQIMSGIKQQQQQRDVFGGAQAEPRSR
jgi:hypothetical protein